MDNRIELMRVVVPPEASGQRLGEFLRRRGLSRTLINRLKNSEGILVNGEVRWTIDPVFAGEEVVLLLEDEPSSYVQPEPIPIAVVYEDDDVLAVNKPAGLIVHPARGYRNGTLANAVAYHLQQQGLEVPVRPVHRLDMETSGLVLFAKNPWAHNVMSLQLERRLLRREYIAVVSGHLWPEDGQVNAPIRRVPNHPVKHEVGEGGRPALTYYRVVRKLKDADLVELKLDTGRTHQIRVHMAYLGHPLLGDQLYGGPTDRIQRQALHAFRLRFRRPRDGEEITLEAPLPQDMADLIAQLEPEGQG
ncbi:MAG: RluA family pseudouridine synthase [Bacillota bacterium]|nr:MAG: RluA family pseudouridine synthase [Bacillota bacterium]